MFEELQDQLDDIFCSIKPPEPSLREEHRRVYGSSNQTRGYSNQTYRAPEMSSYNTASGVVFMENVWLKHLMEIKMYVI